MAEELAAIVGGQHVSDDPQRLEQCAIDGVAPQAVVAPGSAEEVAAVLKLASARGWVVVPAGGFTRQATGELAERVDIVLDTGRMNSFAHQDELTISVGAGLSLGELEARLAEHDQMLPLDPPRAASATIGGVLASAAAGPLQHGFGSLRDLCTGIRFVTGDGRLADTRLSLKNISGDDLKKLLIGSHGTLGVITAADFKVFPRPRQTRTFVLDFLLSTGAVQFRDRLLKSPLRFLCAELVSPQAREYLPGLQGRNWALLLRAAGADDVVAACRHDLGHYVVRELAGEPEQAAWRAVADFPETVAARHSNAMLIDVSVPAEWVGMVLQAAQESGTDNNFLPAVLGRGCVGAMVVAFIPLAVDPPAAIQYVNAASAFRSFLPPQASAVVLRCPREAKPLFSVWGSIPHLEAMQAARRALDPAGILNRGRFLV